MAWHSTALRLDICTAGAVRNPQGTTPREGDDRRRRPHAARLPAARRVLLVATGALAALGTTPVLGGTAASAATNAGAAEIVGQNGAPLNSGGSETPFTLKLPNGSACPGDTAHKGYLLFSYTVPINVAPDRVTFPSNSPNIGVDLIDINGEPFVSQATGVDTGAVPPSPPFVWSRYDHHPEALPPGTYNVGLACVYDYRVVRYWNARVTFVANASDPGGFTWTASASVRPSTGGSSGDLWIVVAAVAGGLVVAAVVAWWLRRARKPIAGSSLNP
jgi:hypothetical protein